MDDIATLGGPVWNGIDVLLDDGFRALRDKRLGIVTNHTGLTLDGRRTVDVLHGDDTVRLDRIFAPEHGLLGSTAGGEEIGDSTDASTGLPVFGLYGVRDRPDASQLHGLDAMLFDVQDVGCRFYTFESTLGYLLEACADAGVRVVVLDRPNPIDGHSVEGPSSDPALESITNYHAIPIRHGMTVGELAKLYDVERGIGADVSVAKMQGWRRDFMFDQTGQIWADPSPNIRDLVAAALYPGLGLLEATNLSVGRGTSEPFHVIGAPWLDSAGLVQRLEHAELPGLKFETITFTPEDPLHPHGGAVCNGVRFLVEDLAEIVPTALGLALIRALRAGHKAVWDFENVGALLARQDLLEAIEDDAEEIEELWQPDPDFFDIRARYLLY